MADARTQRELRRLKIDTREDQVDVQHGGRQLRRRVVPPIPPPRVSSAPIQHTENVSQHTSKRDTTSHITHVHPPESTPTMESSEVESIDRQLRYATSQMFRERYRLDDEQSTTSADPTSPTVMNRSQSETPSDSQYMTPIR